MTSEPNNLGPESEDTPVNDAPRRAASARFTVAKPGEESLREALDPATNSLGDALKLSYRILQLGIVALVVSFLFSGFKSVNEGDTGVRTLFGAIAGADGERELQPGFQPFWPYPVGDLIVFPASYSGDRGVLLLRDFWPRGAPQTRLEDQIESASPDAGLRPGAVGMGDGSLLTKDGDIAHAQLEVAFEIEDAVRFVKSMEPRRAVEFVAATVRQGAVEAASTLTLAEFTESRDILGPVIAERAQRVLDRLDVGIRISSVTATQRIAPLAIQNRLRTVQAERENAKAAVERARQEAVTLLTEVAGGQVYLELLALIREYEELLGAGKTVEAEAKLVELGRRMESPDVGGEVAREIARAKAAEAGVRVSLERDLRRIESLVPSYRDSGNQVVRQIWLDAVRQVLEDPQAEVYAGPDLLGSIALRLTSSAEIMQLRRNAEMERRKAEQAAKESGRFFTPNSEQIMIDRAGRLLKRDASGGLGTSGSSNAP